MLYLNVVHLKSRQALLGQKYKKLFIWQARKERLLGAAPMKFALD